MRSGCVRLQTVREARRSLIQVFFNIQKDDARLADFEKMFKDVGGVPQGQQPMRVLTCRQQQLTFITCARNRKRILRIHRQRIGLTRTVQSV